MGLGHQAFISNANDCRSFCCSDSKCNVWQWTENSATGCWTGTIKDPHSCPKDKGILSQGREYPPPSPPPPPGSEVCTQPECQVDFDDSNWRDVSVPHDFVVEENFTSSGDKSHGYLPFGLAWYRLRFVLPVEFQDRAIWIDFDGTYRAASIWLNGEKLGSHESGYTSYRFQIGTGSHFNQSLLRFGSDNVLVVHVDTTHPDNWWYDGGHIQTRMA